MHSCTGSVSALKVACMQKNIQNWSWHTYLIIKREFRENISTTCNKFSDFRFADSWKFFYSSNKIFAETPIFLCTGILSTLSIQLHVCTESLSALRIQMHVCTKSLSALRQLKSVHFCISAENYAYKYDVDFNMVACTKLFKREFDIWKCYIVENSSID